MVSAVPRFRSLHRWDVSPKRARSIQEDLAAAVRLEPYRDRPQHIAGADISYDRGDDRMYAAIVVLDGKTLEVVAKATAMERVPFPYVPGLLSFREGPAVSKAWSRLRTKPDVLLCDGQGYAHPRRFGLACHLGVLFDIPTVGCAKSWLIGTHREPGERRGNRAQLVDRGERIGTVLRTRDGVKPMYISPGHRMDFASAERLTLACARRFRMPEATRQAHMAVNELRREQR